MAIGDVLGHLGPAAQPYIVVAALAVIGPRGTFGLMILMIAIAASIILCGGDQDGRRPPDHAGSSARLHRSRAR